MKKLNIVVIDGHTLNPGDLSWEPLKELGECNFYGRTDESQILERSKHADILLTNKVPLSKEILESLPHLELIVVTATGVNVVDLQAANTLNIPVTNVPAYGANSVAQMVFAHILNLTQQVGYHNQSVKEEKWVNSADWCYWDFPLVELSGKKIGVIGYGQIGKKVAHIALAFGMDVLINTRRNMHNLQAGVRQEDFNTLLTQSDIVSLHCPLTDKTNRLINNKSLTLMKKNAFLINTGRGGLIDEHALANALEKKQIAGAGLDVLSSEPPNMNNPLLNAPNCYITPHIAWATKEARQRLLDIVVENVKSFLRGKTQNRVN
jgi:glycerate dehydrogenase